MKTYRFDDVSPRESRLMTNLQFVTDSVGVLQWRVPAGFLFRPIAIGHNFQCSAVVGVRTLYIIAEWQGGAFLQCYSPLGLVANDAVNFTAQVGNVPAIGGAGFLVIPLPEWILPGECLVEMNALGIQAGDALTQPFIMGELWRGAS